MSYNYRQSETKKVFYCNWRLAEYLRRKDGKGYGKDGTLHSTYIIMYMGKPFWKFENYEDIFKVGKVTSSLIQEFAQTHQELIGDESAIYVKDTRLNKRVKYHYFYRKYDKKAKTNDFSELWGSKYDRLKQEEYWDMYNIPYKPVSKAA